MTESRDEELIPDHRSLVRPAEVVEAKLAKLAGMVPISVMVTRRVIKRRREDHRGTADATVTETKGTDGKAAETPATVDLSRIAGTLILDREAVEKLPRASCLRCGLAVRIRPHHYVFEPVMLDERIGCDGERVLNWHQCQTAPQAEGAKRRFLR